MEGSASAFPDWALLPSLVLHLISEKFKSITDYVRFRAVCSPWRSASLAKPCHLPFQLPWLMMPHPWNQQDDRIIPHPWNQQDDGIRLFYDLWQEKMHKIHLPEIIGKTCCASYRGWLLIVAHGSKELFLLNPLTRAHVELPPFTIRINDDVFDLFREKMITKITFSSDLTDPNCIIMVVLCRSQGVYFCKVGDFCWTAVPHPIWKKNVPLPVRRPLLQDAAYNNGSVYLLYEFTMVIYDLNTQRLQRTYLFKPKARLATKFFLVGKSGVYFVVFYCAKGVREARQQKIVLYQVQEQPMVEGIADTSNITIFQGDENNYLAVCADDWDSLEGDCMYSASHNCVDWHSLADESYEIYVAKLDAGKPKPVVLGLGKGLLNSWHMLKPELKMWFQPSLV